MHAMPPFDSQAPSKSVTRPMISGTFHLLFPHLEFFKSNQQKSSTVKVQGSQTIDPFSSYPLRQSVTETEPSKKKSFLGGIGLALEEKKKDYIEKSKEKKQQKRLRYITPLIKSMSEIILADDFLNSNIFKAFFLCYSLVDSDETVWSSLRVMLYDGPTEDTQKYISKFTEEKRRILCSILYWVEKYPKDFSSKITLDLRQSLNHFPPQKWFNKKILYENALYDNLLKETQKCLKTIIERLSNYRKQPNSRDRIPYLILTRKYSSNDTLIDHTNSPTKLQNEPSPKLSDNDFKAFSSLVTFDATTIAFQYTLLSIERYNSIDPRDFIGKIQLQDPTLNQMKLSEQMSRWVATTILHPTLSLYQRKTMLIKWVDIASCCKTLRNYNALVEIIAGLSINPLYRLQNLLWNSTSSTTVQTYNNLLNLVSPSNNFKVLRASIMTQDINQNIKTKTESPSRGISSYKVGSHGITRQDIKSSQTGSAISINLNKNNNNPSASVKIQPVVNTVPCIPYFGLLFRDCTFIQDSVSHLPGEIPNMYKLERLYSIIQQCLIHQNCQNVPPYNEITKVSAVYAIVTTTMSQIMSLPELDAMSLVIKPDSDTVDSP